MCTPIVCLFIFIWLVRTMRATVDLTYLSKLCFMPFPHTHSINILLNAWSIERINRLSVLFSCDLYALCVYIVQCTLCALSAVRHTCSRLSDAFQLKSNKTPSIAPLRLIDICTIHIVLVRHSDSASCFYYSTALQSNECCRRLLILCPLRLLIKCWQQHHFYHLPFEW